MSAGSGRIIRGPARPGRKTKHLIPTLQRGDIAIVDHPDMDGLSAEGLVARRVAAVINAAESLTGRYPASGARVLLDADVPVFDCAGSDLLDRVQPGTELTIHSDGEIRHGSDRLAAARPLTPTVLEEGLARARAHVASEMDAFVQNTLSYLSQEWSLLFDDRALPNIRTQIRGRDVLIVVRGEGYREDLRAIRSYARDVRPVIIGVDGAADALLELGLRPDIILGDMDSVSDAALRCGAEIIVHGYQNRAARPEQNSAAAPGLARVERSGLTATVLHALGTSEDVALLLAERKGARLIVMVGSHFSLQEFLDKGRKGMSSTFLARLRVGSILVDAKGVSRLYRRGLRLQHVAWIVLAALVLLVAILSVSSGARALLDLAVVRLQLWLRYL